jgi:hypothetical protein
MLLLGVPAALLLIVFLVDLISGGGHPPLSAALVYWALYPTLTGYLSRALLGSDFPSAFLVLFGLMEYPLVGFLGRCATRRPFPAQSAIGESAPVANANPAVADAAVDRIRESGDPAALPRLQQKLVDDFSQRGRLEANLLDALTVVGGAKGWQDLLESERLGVAGREAWAWRFIINNVREMTNPPYAASRGGDKSPYLGEGDIARLSDALALDLAERLKVRSARGALSVIGDHLPPESPLFGSQCRCGVDSRRPARREECCNRRHKCEDAGHQRDR